MRRPATQRCKCAVGEEVVGEKLAGQFVTQWCKGTTLGRMGQRGPAGYGSPGGVTSTTQTEILRDSSSVSVACRRWRNSSAVDGRGPEGAGWHGPENKIDAISTCCGVARILRD